MLIQVGETTAPGPDGRPQRYRVLQALDPHTELPIAQVPIPVEAAEAVGNAIAGKEIGSRIVVPGQNGAPPAPSDLN